MYRRTFVRSGVFSVLAEELKKVPAYFSSRAKQEAKPYVESASKTMDFLKGEDPNEDAATREKRRQHKEMYQAILQQQAAKASSEAAQRRADLSWKQKLQLSLQEAKELLVQATSTKAGAMAILQHCTASHAAEVALEQGIDVKNVQMVLEKAAANNAVGYEEVVVGYIDAPAASREEVMAFAAKLHKACPVANSMHIEWRQGGADSQQQQQRPSYEASSESARSADVLQREVDQAINKVDWVDSQATGSAGAAGAESVPAGTPGSRQAYSSRPGWSSGSTVSGGRRAGGLRDDGDDDALHLPGIKRRGGTAFDDAEHTRTSQPSTSPADTASAPRAPSTAPKPEAPAEAAAGSPVPDAEKPPSTKP